jgi:putative oxidoreductase
VTANDEEYGKSRQKSPFSDSGYYDPAPAQGTTVLSSPEDLDFGDEESTRWHGGLDFGLLIVRLALGGILGAHGLQKVFGTFNGPGAPEFARILADHGFLTHPTILSWAGGIAEVAGSGLLILGLFTPAAAAMLLSVTAIVVYLGYGNGFFLGTGDGFEYHLLLAATAFGLLFTGPGRLSLDVNTPWRRKPVPFAFLGVVLAGAAVAVVITLFR